MLQNDHKLYIVTRSDLSAGLQAAQCCHAISKFYEEHLLTAKDWYKCSNYICILSTESIEQLSLIKVILENNDLKIKFTNS